MLLPFMSSCEVEIKEQYRILLFLTRMTEIYQRSMG